MLSTQTFEAHSVALAHEAPLGLRGPPQMLLTQTFEAHSVALAHEAPLGLRGPPQMLFVHGAFGGAGA
ncbi:MAG: hypothetical protein ABR878_17225 [Roseiarcus sp.]